MMYKITVKRPEARCRTVLTAVSKKQAKMMIDYEISVGHKVIIDNQDVENLINEMRSDYLKSLQAA